MTWPCLDKTVGRVRYGTFVFPNLVVQVMKRQRSGKIVNLASIASRGVRPTSSGAYAAAKGLL